MPINIPIVTKPAHPNSTPFLVRSATHTENSVTTEGDANEIPEAAETPGSAEMLERADQEESDQRRRGGSRPERKSSGRARERMKVLVHGEEDSESELGGADLWGGEVSTESEYEAEDIKEETEEEELEDIMIEIDLEDDQEFAQVPT